jgi:hypothetical protein
MVVVAVLVGSAARAADDPQAVLEGAFRPGQAVTLGGLKLFVEKVVGGKLVLSPPRERGGRAAPSPFTGRAGVGV